jgi:hypothetical protein
MMVDMFKFDDKLIQNIRINQSRARSLKNLKKKIEKEAGVYVRESEIVNYLIDVGVPRLQVSKEGMELD